MALSKVTLICDQGDGAGNYLTQGTGYLSPSTVLTDATDHLVAGTKPVIAVAFHAGTGPPQVELIACDNDDILPAPGGWTWIYTPPAATGVPPFGFELNASGGAAQYLSAQVPASTPQDPAFWLPLPSGTPSAGEVPVATGTGQASAWGGAVAAPVVELTDAATIAISAAAGNRFRAALGGDRELGTPADPVGDGQMILVEFIQDDTGGRTLTLSDGYGFLDNLPESAIVLTSTPGARNFLGISYDADTGLWYCLAFL